MHADVALREAAVDGVGNRVHADIGIRVAKQRMCMGVCDAAKPDMITFGKCVDVKAVAKSDVHAVSHQPKGACKVRLARDLEIVFRAFDNGNGQPCAAGDFDIVGRGGGMRAVSIEDRLKAETLRRLRTVKPGPVLSAADQVVMTSQRASVTSTAGAAASWVPRAAMTRAMTAE